MAAMLSKCCMKSQLLNSSNILEATCEAGYGRVYQSTDCDADSDSSPRHSDIIFINLRMGLYGIMKPKRGSRGKQRDFRGYLFKTYDAKASSARLTSC